MQRNGFVGLYIVSVSVFDVVFIFQLGLSETHGLRWFEEPGSHVLHELTSTDALLHKYPQEGNYIIMIIHTTRAQMIIHTT